MVRGLVRRRLLRVLAGTKSAGAEERQQAGFAGWVVAASYKGYAHGGAFEYSPGVSIRGLWIPNRAVISYLKMQGGFARCMAENRRANSAPGARAGSKSVPSGL